MYVCKPLQDAPHIKHKIMGRKTKQASLETRQQILDAAMQEFARRGVSSTSLNDIALAAGVTRGAIYWHFKNKVDIFNAMWTQVESSIDDVELRYRNQFPSEPLSALRQTMIYVLQTTVTDPRRRTLLGILFHKCEFVGDLVSLQQIHQSLYLENYERIEKILRLCIEYKQLDKDLDIRLAAITLRAYICGLIENWLFMPEAYPLETDATRLVDAFIELLKYGLMMRKTCQVQSVEVSQTIGN
ncbi:DNA-binding transcriptional repressor AcrR [Pragia fontium]|uniref:Transcriptional regulator, TetR family n=3 Tax=Pragia fontium TaxID=82985 RepID=A0AAJ4W8S2_9GAMM|nr:DNA-binding transcriptional repressor AcrR [Pragia fontium]SFC34060.1 transcriptional regulator, TetR family [Pragia fontium DSM 5563 = ATCC 49100]VEJ54506.1 Potential acrAB operon repressor [Pragia fontium]